MVSIGLQTIRHTMETYHYSTIQTEIILDEILMREAMAHIHDGHDEHSLPEQRCHETT